MDKTVRYRVYGVIDTDGEGVDDVLSQIREYGDATCVDVEVLEQKSPPLPDASDDFKEYVAKLKHKEGEGVAAALSVLIGKYWQNQGSDGKPFQLHPGEFIACIGSSHGKDIPSYWREAQKSLKAYNERGIPIIEKKKEVQGEKRG